MLGNLLVVNFDPWGSHVHELANGAMLVRVDGEPIIRWNREEGATNYEWQLWLGKEESLFDETGPVMLSSGAGDETEVLLKGPITTPSAGRSGRQW